MGGFNTAYFQSEITNLNSISADLTTYSTYVTRVTGAGGMSCVQLAELLAVAAIKIEKATSQTNTIGSNVSTKSTAMLSKIESTIAKIAPLLTAPTDLPSVITWITAAIEMYAGPTATLTAQETIVAAEASEVAVAVTNCLGAITSLATTINNAVAAQQGSQGCI